MSFLDRKDVKPVDRAKLEIKGAADTSNPISNSAVDPCKVPVDITKEEEEEEEEATTAVRVNGILFRKF